MGGARFPATQQDNRGAAVDEVLPLPLLYPGHKPLLHVIDPILLIHRLVVDQRVDPAVEVALEREGERKVGERGGRKLSRREGGRKRRRGE